MEKRDTVADYRPEENEPYMNPRQLGYFRGLLMEWRRRLLREERGILAVLQHNETVPADPLDQGVEMAARDFELTSKLRNRKLLKQIEAALQRIDEGSYGYCLESGEQIGLRRLEILPFATLSVEAQEQMEHARRMHSYRPGESSLRGS